VKGNFDDPAQNLWQEVQIFSTQKSGSVKNFFIKNTLFPKTVPVET